MSVPALCARAHPRSRGEHTISGFGFFGNTGSSPLARGTRTVTIEEYNGAGLIPARAGNTHCSGEWWSWCGAHPRSRGEHDELRCTTTESVGSSPLARGTRRELKTMGDFVGLIPARAGNTKIQSPSLKSRGAHPRSRGEHRARRWVSLIRQGSSPLARGTLLRAAGTGWWHGLIPARAGNTFVEHAKEIASRAHPRSRGEHLEAAHSGSGCWGSSPLARGTPNLRPDTQAFAGLIPARAGNTWWVRVRRFRARAHPRSRGEHGAFVC